MNIDKKLQIAGLLNVC